ncbi:MAG: cob(I)yrinic acid a,c-diamide adenosyltransferase [Acholeplasmataceae bacterium]|jgi:cob(I)alamin adenosyltransferase|nr:cob(I)yrinic acid a,c-diamide adenosyltransferase [Acholeplasmataceae bacterium]
MKIYTKRGDQGQTDLLTKRVQKTDLRISVNGAIDETMAYVLMTKHEITDQQVISDLDMIHEDLFQMAYEIALSNENKHVIKKERVEWIESRIDFYDDKLRPLSKFIKLDQTKAASWLNMIRVMSRRAERELVYLNEQQHLNEYTMAYINRLSDYMFTLGRYFDEVVKGEMK